MGASRRFITVAAVCCAVQFGPQTAFAESNGWLGRLASVTRAFIPDINFAAYLNREEMRKDVSEQPAEQDPMSEDLWLFHIQGAAEKSSATTGQTYSVRVVDSELENTWSSLGSSLLMQDAAVESKVGGLGRSALAAAPTPMYGLDIDVNFSPRWKLGVRGRILDTTSSDLDTSMSTYSAALEFAAKEKLSLGFGYEQFETYSDAQLRNTTGYVSYRYSGPRVFTTLRF